MFYVVGTLMNIYTMEPSDGSQQAYVLMIDGYMIWRQIGISSPITTKHERAVSLSF